MSRDVWEGASSGVNVSGLGLAGLCLTDLGCLGKCFSE